MPEHPYGWLSLLPPLAAIVLAIATRRVLAALLSGVFVGALLLEGGDFAAAVAATCEQHLWPSLADSDHLRVFAFTTLMGAMVGVMQRAGGFEGIVRRLARLARSRRGGQLTVWGLGLVVFFDDYANSLLLGHTMRPLTDRLKISREKLAYLVDSTAAPVSGLALVSTWVAGEIGFIRDGFAQLELASPVDGFDIFIASIPFRFYVLWTLLLVPMVALLGRELGSMWQAEVDARRRPAPRAVADDAAAPRSGAWWDGVLPILAVLGVTIGLIFLTGSRGLDEDAGLDRSWLDRFGNGDSYLALVYGALAGLMTALVLARAQGILRGEQVRDAALTGAQHVLPALAILWLAWSLSGLTGSEYLGTGRYLGSLLQQTLDVRWMPTAVFALASLVSFATGTSWGTMGLLMPLVVAVTTEMLSSGGVPFSPRDPLLVATIGSVLAGAIFGDHCSPISDTTVLSSQASGCDHIAHVRTQMPYALMTGAVSIVCGTIPVGFGVPVWYLLPLGPLALLLLMLGCGRAVGHEE